MHITRRRLIQSMPLAALGISGCTAASVDLADDTGSLEYTPEVDTNADFYAVVNLDKYWLHLFKDDELALFSRVIVGREGRDSPTMRDNIVNLKFSPDWTVPTSIAKADFPAKLEEDPGYLDSRGYTARLNGRRVDNSEITPENVGNAQLVRRPGPQNPLGGVRFSLTNSYGIYLHDTPNRDLFDVRERRFSSGCIRIQKADEFALALLQNDGHDVTMEDVQERMNQTDVSFQRLRRKVPVFIIHDA